MNVGDHIKAGDLIFWHGRNTIALVVHVDVYITDVAPVVKRMWVCLLEAGDDLITHDPLDDGYTVIDKNWFWPEWHINHGDNK